MITFLRHLHENTIKVWWSAKCLLHRLELPESWAEPFYRFSLYAQLWLFRYLMPEKTFYMNKNSVYSLDGG